MAIRSPFYKRKIITIIIIYLAIYSISFGQKTEFPYSLKRSDLIIGGAALSAELYAKYREHHQEPMAYDELFDLNKSQINRFDRSATNYWNKSLHKTSELTRAALIVSPSILLLNEGKNKQWKNCITYGIMYIEVGLLTIGITDLTKTLVMRKRPYLYNPDVSLPEKEQKIEDDDATDSFFSGHAASAFASAVFFSKTYTDIYGNNTFSKIIWGTSLTLAATTSYLRYRSGYHFPTDVLAGACIGSAIGYLIPVLHKRRSDNFNYALTANSIHLSYSF
jgi:membrane-associated phospholipid phosphatase